MADRAIAASVLLGLFLVSTSAAGAPGADPPTSDRVPTDIGAEQQQTATVRMLYSGNQLGVGGGRYQFRAAAAVSRAAAAAGGRVTALLPHHGCMIQGAHVLLAPDRRVATLLAMLEHGPVTCSDPRPAVRATVDGEPLLLLEPSTAGELLTGAGPSPPVRSPVHLRTCTNAEGTEALLVGPAFGAREPQSWLPTSFDFRLALHVEVEISGRSIPVEIIGSPREEPAERFARLMALRDAHEDAIYADAGSFVDGASTVRDGALSLHRPLGFAMLSRLEPTAAVPGETELVRGPKRLKDEARQHGLRYIATNWRSEEDALELEASVLVDVEAEPEPVRVALLGVVAPSVASLVPALRQEGVTLTDPVEAVREELARLAGSERPPDLVIVLTAAGSAVIEDLAGGGLGVDLVVGRTARKEDRVRAKQLDLRPSSDTRRSAAAALRLGAGSTAEVQLRRHDARWALASLRALPHPDAGEVAPDPIVRAEVTRTRAAVYPELDRPLLPEPPGPRPGAWRGESWTKLVCEAAAASTEADVMLLPELPEAPPIPGPLSELLVVDRLALLDHLEAHSVPGQKLGKLLSAATKWAPIRCGASASGKKVRGRPIDPDRAYRVVTSDRVRLAGFDDALRGALSDRLLDRPGTHTITGAYDAPLTLRSAVLEELRARRDAGGPEAALALLSPSAERRDPDLLVRVSRLSLTIERFNGAEDAAFAKVPETLATSPSSLTVGGELDTALAYDSSRLAADLRVRSLYKRLSFDEGDTQEPADDLRISSSASLPGLAFPVAASLKLMPFSEILLDTELTPVEQDGDTLDRQADLSLTLGIAAARTASLKTMRLGVLAQRDLSHTSQPTELGLRTEIETAFLLGAGLRFTTNLDATAYANTDDDDESDLRFKGLLEGRLSLPLARYLDLSVFGRGFAFSGRVPRTEQLRLSWAMGFAVDVRGVFPLN